MRKTLALIALCGAALPASAEDRPLEQLVATCAACHGERGDQALQPEYPLLAGQHADYLEITLKQYREGTRRDAVMNGQAAGLSDREIRALSRHYARQEPVIYTPRYSTLEE